MEIWRAIIEDLTAILELQHLAFQSEAVQVGSLNIQPLTQTLEELTEEWDLGVMYKAVDHNGMIVGSVRGRIDERVLYIGKLIVHPDFRERGIGTALLREIEQGNQELTKVLFTSDLSERNIRLYEKNGYRPFRTEPTAGGFNLIYLQK